jgi:hypothetical protein
VCYALAFDKQPAQVGPELSGEPRSLPGFAARRMNRNPNFEYRNPKQIRNSNDQLSAFRAWDFGFVSDFDIRISDLANAPHSPMKDDRYGTV